MDDPGPPAPSKTPKPSRHDGPARIGRFTILDRIGAGGMGELFLAWDPQLDRKLAIKLVHTRASGPAAEQRLRLEAKALAQLSHPNVVQVFEVGTHASRVYVAMEFVEGESLRDKLAALGLDGAKRVAAILECFLAAGRGLEAVHGAGLVHRDFKPSNVVVGEDGRVRIIDFGLASELDDDEDPPGGPSTPVDVERGRKHWDTTLTDTGVLLGTPRYMAPEQWRGRPGDQRSDQFGFCVALFEALYGVHPFERPDVDFAEAIGSGQIEFPVRRPELVPARVREALARGLSGDPSLRFASMGELLERIAPPPMTGRRALVGGLGILLAAAITLALLLRPEPDDAGTSMLAHTRREALALRDLVRVEQRVIELDAQGQLAEADATFAAFAELSEYATTTALGHGWLNHAGRLAARGDCDGELDAYGAAYLSASLDTQREALFGLARVFARTRQWAQLGAALDVIEALTDPLDDVHGAELLGMRVIEMVSRRELFGAAQALTSAAPGSDLAIHPALASSIVALGQSTATEHRLDGYELRLAAMPGLDLDHDGVGELLVHRPDEARLTVLGSATASLDALATIELPEVPNGLSILPDADAPMLSLRHGTRLSLHRVSASETDGALTLTQLFELEQGHAWPTRWTSGDLDDDGRIEAYASLTPLRRLLVAQPGGEAAGDASESPWVHGDPHPATAAADSVPYDLVIGDLDGDARLELAVAVGEWSAYDLRILGLSSTTAALELLGRRKLGTVQSLTLLAAPTGKGMWIAVGVSDLYPSRRVFPSPPAHGVAGVYVFAWDGAALEQIAFVDVAAPDLIYAGDFNADGLADLALASHSRGEFTTTVLVQTAPGVFEPMMLVELWPIGVIDRDRDGDDELLVLDTSEEPESSERPQGRLYVLGSGDDRLSALANPAPTRGVALDPHVEDTLGASIARAEDLATIGLSLRAAAELRKLARVAEPELAAHLSVRAAELLEAQGHRLEAADLYAGASTDARLLGTGTGLARREAMQLYEQVHRFRAAADMAASALELGTDPALQAEHARLEALANDDRQLVFDFDDPLDAGWIVDPLAVRRRAGRLELSFGGSEQDILARRELDWRGGRLALEVELEIERIEWSSEIIVELRPLDGGPQASLHVGAATRGGGGLYQLLLRCAGENVPEPGAEGYPISQPQAELPDDQRRFRLRAELVPGRTWCTADGSGVHVETALQDPGLAPGRYELVIHGAQVERWGRATASIDRIVITGADTAAAVPDPDPQASSLAEHIARELAEGRMQAALAALDDARARLELDPRDRALLQFIALDELGQPDQREAALIAAVGRCGDDERGRMLVGRLLRQRPEHLGADLRRLCGADDYFAILVEVWGSAIYQHPESATVGRVLTTQTAGLERWQPRDPADRHAVLTLLCARARARSSLDTPGPNRADLERAVELGDRWLSEDEHQAVGPTKLATRLGWCRVDLAAERLDRGEEDGAIETLRETLRRSPTPEVLADMLTIDPRFVSLRERAAWRELIEPARAGGRP